MANEGIQQIIVNVVMFFLIWMEKVRRPIVMRLMEIVYVVLCHYLSSRPCEYKNTQKSVNNIFLKFFLYENEILSSFIELCFFQDIYYA